MVKNIIIIAAVIGICFLIGWGIYKVQFQFNDQDVRDYINEEANKYDADKRLAAFKIINDMVKDTLLDRQLSSAVLNTAKMNGTPPEMELVHTAVMRCRSYGYLK